MRKRRTYKPISPPPAKQVFLISCVFFIIFSIISILIVNAGIKPVLLEVATARNEQYANQAIGIAINKRLNEELQVEDLIIFEYNDNGEVESFKINGTVENRVQHNIHNRVENYLKQLEKGVVPDSTTPLDVEIDEQEQDRGIDEVREKENLVEVPLGQIFDIPLLANLGPKIPVNLEVVGIVSTEIETEVIERSINNIYIRPLVHIEVEIQTIIPFASEPAEIKQTIPLGGAGYQGDVPMYYNNGNSDEMPDFSIPIEEP
ncbi:sporulation protein YunB [Aquibacillus sediminis]|uniref:sporulation protein YunB n=1 Tax=Aquibacillus sediminis TaxID=2574734 RepID=UPI001109DA3B|nr:sporulation protein YunB [Aquibacillus sediminis]